MELKLATTDLAAVDTDLLVIGLYESPAGLTGIGSDIDGLTDGLLRKHLNHFEFEAKALETLVLHSPVGLRAKHLLIIGLGKSQKFTPIVARQVSAQSSLEAHKLKCRSLSTLIHGTDLDSIDQSAVTQAVAEGLLLGDYQFTKFKTQNKEKQAILNHVELLVIDPKMTDHAICAKAIDKAQAIARPIMAIRDLVNEPPSHLKPISLVEYASGLAKRSDLVNLTVLDKEQLKKQSYEALLAVASGSDEPPYLIDLHYRPKNASQSVVLVGKGVTFDSGGLGIKPWSAMLSMKTDMAGAGTVLGIIQALIELEALGQSLPIEVHAVIPTTENMISGKAMRPDDIIETKSGKTIEILHTDAEGRLILSDGLTYGTLLEPDYMIDFATLTGSAIKALGRSYAAFMGNDRKLLDIIGVASRSTGELAWELPLPEEYKKQLESPVADLQNISTNEYSPGAIIGGLFLQEFVNEIPWAHIDIAGPSFIEEVTNPVYPKGATGYGILLSLEILKQLKR